METSSDPVLADPVLAVSVAEAARRLSLGRSVFYAQLLGPRRIRSFRIGTRRLIPVAELERLTRELLDEQEDQ